MAEELEAAADEQAVVPLPQSTEAVADQDLGEFLSSHRRGSILKCYPLSSDSQPFELSLYLPERPLLPAGHVTAGLPETPSPLKVAVTPLESLNELRITITDSPEGYWLGAFCFRRPSSHNAQANGTGKKRLGEKVNEWTELKEIFKDVPRDERILHIAHGELDHLC